jgi:manganese/zinc/iron transport system permease protein
MDLFSDYTIRTVALGAAILGCVSGALGTFAVLRQQSLLGDAVSHAALPGIVLAYLITGSKASIVLMAGAGLVGLLATGLILSVTRNTRIKFDTALGIALSVFFGFGLVLLTYLQGRPDANQAGLETFLFGQAAALVTHDVVTMAVVGGLAVAIVAMFWKEFKLASFDVDFGQSLGLKMRMIEGLLMILFVVAIVIGLEAVGVVLMSALLIAPAAAARQWTDRLSIMFFVAAAIGGVSGVVGALISATGPSIPTGPIIVLCAGVFVAVSLMLAPRRGLVWRWIRDWRNGRKLRMEAVLLDLFALASQHERPDYPHEAAVLDLMANPIAGSAKSLAALADRGLVTRVGSSQWSLTQAGVARVRAIRAERFGETHP